MAHSEQLLMGDDGSKILQIATEAAFAYRQAPNDGISRFLALKPYVEQSSVRALQSKLIYPADDERVKDSRFPSLSRSVRRVAALARIDTSIALVVASSTLATTTILAACTEDMTAHHLGLFLDEDRDSALPLACLTLSEPKGTANFMEPGGPGLSTVARLEGDYWVVSGDKIWVTSMPGWDSQGPDTICLVCRDQSIEHEKASSPAESLLILVVNREELNVSNFEIIRHMITPGLTATSGPLVRFTSLRVPNNDYHVLAKGGKAALALLEVANRGSIIAAAMALGVMQHAIDELIDFSTSQSRGAAGERKLLDNEAVSQCLAKLRLRHNAAKSLVDMAARKMDDNEADAREVALQSKVFATEEAVQCVTEASRVMGVSSYDKSVSIMSDLLLDAMGLPLIGGGNEMVRKRLAAIAREEALKRPA